jgi:hypothetical protein
MQTFSSISTPNIKNKSTNHDLGSTRKSSFFKPLIQPKFTVGQPNDVYEQEADAQADRVMRMPVGDQPFFSAKPASVSRLQRKCSHCEEEENKLQMKGESASGTATTAPPAVNDVIHSPGQSLDVGTKHFMESRFGYDFGNVQIHNDSLAHQSSSDIHALAYTYGNHVAFGAGQYQPNTLSGRQLLAHELTHVIQQKESKIVQRSPGPPSDKSKSDPIADIDALLAQRFSDSDDPQLAERRKKLSKLFDSLNRTQARSVAKRISNLKGGDNFAINFQRLATPTRRELIDVLYARIDLLDSAIELAADLAGESNACKPFTKEEIDDGFPLKLGTSIEYFINDDLRSKYGDETANLWEEYITRVPGDSLVPEIFDNPDSEIVAAFIKHPATKQRQIELFDIMEKAILFNCPALKPGIWTNINVKTLLTPTDLNSPFTFTDIFSIPGLIAGGISGSDAGMDSRKVSVKVQLLLTILGSGDATIKMRTNFNFTIHDAIDFCPGATGSWYARPITIPMSRLEASGLAYDKPFIVNYDGPVIDKELNFEGATKCYRTPNPEETKQREMLLKDAEDKSRYQTGGKTPSGRFK